MATVTRDDVAHATDLRRLAATLDVEAPTTVVPALWQWATFLDDVPTASLGDDGHPRAGGLIENPPYPRRMFAGGRMTLHTPLPLDTQLTRVSEVGEITHKEGRSGALAFVTVTHRYLAAGQELAVEEQDLVYRPASDGPQPAQAPDPDPPADEQAAQWHLARTFEETRLFRFSALTFNTHRIHYDHRYTTEIEGYPGLVVHGPMLAIFMLELVRVNAGDEAVASLSFRAKTPAFVGQTVDFLGWVDDRDVRLEARRGGTTLMEASATLR